MTAGMHQLNWEGDTLSLSVHKAKLLCKHLSSFSQVFDVQRKITYKNLANWYKELREYRPEIPCCVVANKIDGESVSDTAYNSDYSALTVVLNVNVTCRSVMFLQFSHIVCLLCPID